MSLRRSLTGPMGLRREVAILVPASLLLLIAIVVFTLLSYRSGVDRLIEVRRDEALAIARAAADDLASGTSPGGALSDVRRRAPGVLGVVLVGPSGVVVASSGEPPTGDPLAPFTAAGEESAVSGVTGQVADDVATDEVAAGPSALLPGTVAAVVPVALGGIPHRLRLDLDAVVLAGQRRGLAVLSVVVVVAGVGVGALLILFLRQLLAPYDTLLARARAAGGEAAVEEDELDLLVRTFERGVAALAAGNGDLDVPVAADAEEMAALRETLAVSLESGLLLLDRRGRVIALNPVGAQQLRLDPPPPETPLAEALAPYPALVRLLAGAVDSGRPIHRHEESLELRGGGSLTLGLTVHPLRRVSGAGAGAPTGGTATEGPAMDEEPERREVRGFLVLFADLTEARRQAEESRLAESLARLGELAAGVAHELRNSLATIRGYLTLIERSPDEPPGAYLAEVRHEADHLQRVLEDFLSFARPGSARVEEVSLAAIAERVAADPAFDGETVTVAVAPGTPRLRGDAQLLERAVRNLLRNAVEANREAAGTQTALPVRVEVGEEAGGVVLRVADRGAGVPPEIADRLFLPFTTGRPGGVGLGLALAHRIVSMHGGNLRLEPAPGGGTVAWMWFPSDRIVTNSNDRASTSTRETSG